MATLTWPIALSTVLVEGRSVRCARCASVSARYVSVRKCRLSLTAVFAPISLL